MQVMTIIDAILPYVGWIATLTFTMSFFVQSKMNLMRVQMVGALIWMWYGFIRQDNPVIFSNILVFSASVINQIREYKRMRSS
jgi:C4-dicarboxylate transporter